MSPAEKMGRSEEVVFLLGAGASADAGIPIVASLTTQLRQLLPTLKDVNGEQRHDFGEVFDFLAARDPSVERNYERFFECIQVVLEDQNDPFGMSRELKNAASYLPFALGSAVASLLRRCDSTPAYLIRLEEFCPPRGRLKIFSLNYDCCVEDACRLADIDCSTGFDSHSKQFALSNFQSPTKGINLYKLHGSLRWVGVQDTRTRSVEPLIFPPIINGVEARGRCEGASLCESWMETSSINIRPWE